METQTLIEEKVRFSGQVVDVVGSVLCLNNGRFFNGFHFSEDPTNPTDLQQYVGKYFELDIAGLGAKKIQHLRLYDSEGGEFLGSFEETGDLYRKEISSAIRTFINTHEIKPTMEEILEIERDIQKECDKFQRRLEDSQRSNTGENWETYG